MLIRYECLRNMVIEITAINVLPEHTPSLYPQLYIVNTDPLPNPGKHWLCVILYNYGQLDYFDSLGRPAEYYGADLHDFLERNGQNHNYVQRRLQSLQSDLCGLYVVYFAVMRLCLHLSIKDIYKVGPTQCGKSMITKKLVENAGAMFTIPPERILYAYSVHQKMFDEMLNIPNLTFHEGLPDKQCLDELADNTEHCLVILDDLMSKIVKSEEILNLFTITSHHKGISVVYLSQNMYNQGKFAKTIALNSANFVLFRNPRDMRQILTFASQILPGQTKFFLDSFQKATEERYSYLLITCDGKRTCTHTQEKYEELMQTKQSECQKCTTKDNVLDDKKTELKQDLENSQRSSGHVPVQSEKD
ncbi:unnamed protein product [Mytilus edulis]|uniref:AAA+ ATPase domain-containing protein n=1 Tax=Mytilus edulis TaxID=6550 RepID=A0A8S3U4R9_MYTED|nr:unnamed protein product [Mytilus edulis]